MDAVRSVIFTLVFAATLFVVDIGVAYLLNPTLDLFFWLLSLKWYWIILLAGIIVPLIGFVWRFASFWVILLGKVISQIARPAFAWNMAKLLVAVNIIWVNYKIWSSVFELGAKSKLILTGLLFTYLTFRVFYGLYLGAKINLREYLKQFINEETA